jgi:hypothetical protein
VELRRQLESEILAVLPWSALDADERASLLGLIRKIVPARDESAASTAIRPAARSREEVSEVLVAPVAGADR